MQEHSTHPANFATATAIAVSNNKHKNNVPNCLGPLILFCGLVGDGTILAFVFVRCPHRQPPQPGRRKKLTSIRKRRRVSWQCFQKVWRRAKSRPRRSRPARRFSSKTNGIALFLFSAHSHVDLGGFRVLATLDGEFNRRSSPAVFTSRLKVTFSPSSWSMRSFVGRLDGLGLAILDGTAQFLVLHGRPLPSCPRRTSCRRRQPSPCPQQLPFFHLIPPLLVRRRATDGDRETDRDGHREHGCN